MIRWLITALLSLASAAAGYVVTVNAIPNIIMGVAIKRVSQDGRAFNVWNHGPRTTEASRAIVRPSPDLAYSSCAYDLSKGPVRITVNPWTDYYSLSLYQANTDNFWVKNDREVDGKAIDILLISKDMKVKAQAGTEVVTSPSKKGIALVRRLAPSEDAFSQAAASRQGDVCKGS
jgi:uncharacterized membrane protein